jgi:hypothetical protein
MDRGSRLNHLKARTGEVAQQATRDMLQRVRQGEEYRLDIRKGTKGVHGGSY